MNQVMSVAHMLYAHMMVSLPIALVVVSNILVGLTSYPKAYSVASAIMKILNLMSVVVHADSPGTLKMPLTQSREPGAGNLPNSGPIGLAVILPFLAAISVAIPGCACSNPLNAGKFGCKVETALIDCSMAAAQPAISQAITDVQAALSGTSINWAALAAAEGAYGIGVVSCAISRLDSANAVSHNRAQQYFLARKVSVKK